ncbi:DUF254-domain-containing protein [Cyathus striatus]|nr:DUF254-domain-containing protein [Cyathus striatus]
MNEGILIQEIEFDTDVAEGEDINAPGRFELSSTDDASKKLLRDHLRKTLSHRSELDTASSQARTKGQQLDFEETLANPAYRYPPREYFVLTDAGKPVFISRSEDDEHDSTTATIGIIQALISVFLDDHDKLRCINAGGTRITFLLRSPLYYVCVSAWGEPESVTRSHLEYLHLQILSIVTATQLRRIFERRTNFDLRRLLNGAETFLKSILGRLEFDLAMSMSSLGCLKLDPNVRKKIAESMVPPAKSKDILYVVMIVNDRVVALVRPRKHSIHPADIHILLNTIHSPSIYNSPASASWIPVCLPKFNPAGFMNAYISFMRKDGVASSTATTPAIELAPVVQGNSPDTTPTLSRKQISDDIDEAGIVLVCISGGGDLEGVRAWSDGVLKKLRQDGTLGSLVNAYISGQTEYSVSELGIPGLRHFVYKSRAQVQITYPTFEDPYDGEDQKRRLMTLYQLVYDGIHAKSGQEGTLKLQYIRTETEAVMGWITQPFELYIVLSPLLPKSAAVGAANAVARWVKKEEARLFLRDAPVF